MDSALTAHPHRHGACLRLRSRTALGWRLGCAPPLLGTVGDRWESCGGFKHPFAETPSGLHLRASRMRAGCRFLTTAASLNREQERQDAAFTPTALVAHRGAAGPAANICVQVPRSAKRLSSRRGHVVASLRGCSQEARQNRGPVGGPSCCPRVAPPTLGVGLGALHGVAAGRAKGFEQAELKTPSPVRLWGRGTGKGALRTLARRPYLASCRRRSKGARLLF